MRPRRTPTLEVIGDTATLVDAAIRVDQFESGVFVGVPRGCVQPKLRPGGLWTEDEEVADMGDAVVEIRAFDTTCVNVATTDEAIACHLAQTFEAAREVKTGSP